MVAYIIYVVYYAKEPTAIRMILAQSETQVATTHML
jgi:hypothetical protein